MKYVKTGLNNGCVIAALAVVTEQTFDEVLTGLREHWKIEAEEDGVDDECWIQYLAARGYAIQDISYEYTPEDRLVENWPIAPFAPAHIVFVYAEGPHAIAMAADGTVYDGNDPTAKSLSDYKRVYRIVGVHKVGNSLGVHRNFTERER